MSLGRFGGSAPLIKRRSGFAGSQDGNDALSAGREKLIPDPAGQPAPPAQLYLPGSNYAINFLRNGDFRSWSSGTSIAPDGWTQSGGSSARNTTNVKVGASSVDLTTALDASAGLLQDITISATQNEYLRSSFVTFACWIRASVASRAILSINDGVRTTNAAFRHSGSGAFELNYVTVQLDSAATQVRCQLEVSAGSVITVQFSGAILSVGKGPVGFSPHISDLLLVPRIASASSRITRTSSAFAAIDGMSVPNVVLDAVQSALIFLSLTHDNSAAGNRNFFRILRDANIIATPFGDTLAAADPGDHTRSQTVTAVHIDRKPGAGVYDYNAEWGVSAGTGAVELRRLIVALFPDA